MTDRKPPARPRRIGGAAHGARWQQGRCQSKLSQWHSGTTKSDYSVPLVLALEFRGVTLCSSQWAVPEVNRLAQTKSRVAIVTHLSASYVPTGDECKKGHSRWLLCSLQLSARMQMACINSSGSFKLSLVLFDFNHDLFSLGWIGSKRIETPFVPSTQQEVVFIPVTSLSGMWFKKIVCEQIYECVLCCSVYNWIYCWALAEVSIEWIKTKK